MAKTISISIRDFTKKLLDESKPKTMQMSEWVETLIHEGIKAKRSET